MSKIIWLRNMLVALVLGWIGVSVAHQAREACRTNRTDARCVEADVRPAITAPGAG